MPKIPIDLQTGNILKTEKSAADLIVGIDLGTTNSLVAYVDEGEVQVVRDSATHQHALVPSVIHFTKEGDIIVGQSALPFLSTQPERTIFSVKRLMGKSYQDLQDYQENLGYQIIDQDEERLVKVRVDDSFYTPIELSAHILRTLKKRVEQQLLRSVSKAVITVPAYFNDAQRQATRDAGKLAGWDVLRIINEPTAASLAYGIGTRRDQAQTIAVYDLGGGTFDLSILALEQGIFEVLATHGNTFLGGDDVDKEIANYWSKQHPNNMFDASALRLAAEEAKIHLSTHKHFETTLAKQKIALDRPTFEKIIEPLVQQTISHCKQALADANLQVADIDEVVMVGGSTRIPFVKATVSSFFGKSVHDELNPDQVVAIGAAIQADILSGNRKDLLLLDVTPLSLGIETVGGLMDVIIPRNTKIPTRAGRQYTTSVDGQVNLKIAVYQGERDGVAHNRKLGEFILSGIPPMPAGLPKIEVQFVIDADGLLRVLAKELRSNTQQSITIKSQYGITEEEMSLMLIESLQYAEQDMAVRSVQEAINEANTVLQATEKFLRQQGDWFSESQIEHLHSLTSTLKHKVELKDKDAIEASLQQLNTYAAPLAQQAMNRTIAKAMKGQDI